MSIALYGLYGSGDPAMLPFFFVPFNFGFGLRSPGGFMRSIVAADGDDTRGSSLTILMIMAAGSGGTALVAPFILGGLGVLASAASAMVAMGVVIMMILPSLDAATTARQD